MSNLLSFDAIRQCEAEIWRALALPIKMTCAHWTGSESVRKALERVLAVAEEQARRASDEKEARP